MNVTICIPVFNDEYSLSRCLWYLDKMNIEIQQFIILENNSVDNTLNIIQEWKKLHSNTKLIRLWFREDAIQCLESPYSIIAIVKQMMLDIVRKSNTDFVIFIDSDMYLLDINAITKLVTLNLDIVSPVYYRTSISQKDTSIAALIENNKVLAIGGGCMCISKRLLMDTRVNFYPLIFRRINKDNTLSKWFSEDFGYCFQANDYGYRCYLDYSINVKHGKSNYYRAWTRINNKYINFRYPEGVFRL